MSSVTRFGCVSSSVSGGSVAGGCVGGGCVGGGSVGGSVAGGSVGGCDKDWTNSGCYSRRCGLLDIVAIERHIADTKCECRRK